MRQAYLSIASGAHDLVAVVGVEKVTDVLDGGLRLCQAWHRRAAGLRGRNSDRRHDTAGDPRRQQGSWREWHLPNDGSGITVFSFTVVRQPPAGYEQQAPYILAL